MLPPIVTLSSLSQAVDAADSPSTAATITPATADLLSSTANTPNGSDYFGDRWKSRSPSNQSTGKRKTSTVPSTRANPPSPLVLDQSTSSKSARPLESVYSPRAASRLTHDERRHSQNTQQRNRADSVKTSGTTEGESSASDNREHSGRQQRRRAPSQKALLSKALAKANHAVVLDGRQNIEGAILAYGDACNLLRQVMLRSSGDEDRKKLEAVVSGRYAWEMLETNVRQRNTYKNRVVELRHTEPSSQNSDSKALPERPIERDSKDSERLSIVTDDEEEDTGIETVNPTPLAPDSGYGSVQHNNHLNPSPYISQKWQSPQPLAYDVEDRRYEPSNPPHSQYLRQFDGPDRNAETSQLQVPAYQEHMPPPLSPGHPLSPALPPKDPESNDESNESDYVRHEKGEHKGEHTSWLNTINESSGSSTSSVHSRRSSVGLRRKHIRAASGQTEADFDAALDAAVEAAYDDGFEPDDEDEDDEQLINDPDYHLEDPEPLSEMRRNVELAKENVREAEREAAVSQAKERERQRLQGIVAARNSIEIDYRDDEAEEEERMLEEMKDYIMDDAEYDLQTKSALPRQSDSSGFSGRTWGSSIGSNPTSAGTSLSTVAEASVMPSMATQLQDNPLPPPVHPPPLGALPPPPMTTGSNLSQQADGFSARPASIAIRNSSPGVRDRRLSGMKAKQLKIETNNKPLPAPALEGLRMQPSAAPPVVPPKEPSELPNPTFVLPESQQMVLDTALRQPLPLSATFPSNRKGSSPFAGSDTAEPFSSTGPSLTKVTSADSDTSVPSMPGSPARYAPKSATGLRKNFSSSSLRNKSMTLSNASDGQDTSPNTSFGSMTSMSKQRRLPSPAVPVLPTPIETSFMSRGHTLGGINLFDCDFHSPTSPGSPNPLASSAPLPLEPCPDSALLRPFWFLRSIYQTIAHPRGGYITNRLFVPRDIWRVKNIKLKNIEEKVSSCDILTAALLKLGKVDTLNADAVLEEMQFLETVMDQVQSNLSKKLGSDVGVQGAASLFKGSNSVEDSASTSEALTLKSTNGNSKSMLSSWRKLRSKNSLGPNLTSASSSNVSRDGAKEAPTMRSLPMTAMQNPRFPRRDLNLLQCTGPNPSYMGALARLCDAVQILGKLWQVSILHMLYH